MKFGKFALSEVVLPIFSFLFLSRLAVDLIDGVFLKIRLWVDTYYPTIVYISKSAHTIRKSLLVGT
jgi:hypothetical protein